MATKVMVLGGRVFAPAEGTTFDQDGYLQAVLYTHRLHDTIEAGGDLLGAVLASGAASPLLAGLLVEDGQPWTPEGAKANRAFFGALTDPGEKAQLSGMLETLLLDFFVVAGKSSPASPPSSAIGATTTTSTTSPTTTATPSAPVLSAPASGHGRPSSAPSPAATPAASPR